ncbi:MAG: hypothetical protein LUI87_12820 [Lachnospiraceae bacterium]|nr:hypothetical protein [Lachnospiraceae bacterium]
MADRNERTAPAWQGALQGQGAPQGRTGADEVTVKFGKGLVGDVWDALYRGGYR